jgi:hypothetical protein
MVIGRKISGDSSGTKAYVLMDVVDGKCDQVTRTLRGGPGVITVDLLEGPPQVVMVVEASERQRLARLTVQAIAEVEMMTEDIQLLPAHDGLIVHAV